MQIQQLAPLLEQYIAGTREAFTLLPIPKQSPAQQRVRATPAATPARRADPSFSKIFEPGLQRLGRAHTLLAKYAMRTIAHDQYPSGLAQALAASITGALSNLKADTKDAASADLLRIVGEVDDFCRAIPDLNELSAVQAQIDDCFKKIREIEQRVTETIARAPNDLDRNFQSRIEATDQKFRDVSQRCDQAVIDTSRRITESANAALAIHLSTFADQTAQIALLQKEATDVLGMTGIPSYSQIFEEQSALHSESQAYWLAATGVSVIAALAWLWFAPAHVSETFMHYTGQPWPPTAMFVYGFSSSVLFGVAIYCARMFRSERHNMVINQHRRNALKAYVGIMSELKDSSARDAILLEITKTIFAQQPTGHGAAGASDGIPLSLAAFIAEAAKASRLDGKSH